MPPHSVILAGLIDENFDFHEKIGSVISEHFTSGIDIFCKEVTRINSAGIRGWRSYFDSLRQDKKVRLRFFDLSPVLVRQFNFITGCVLSHEVESVSLGFICENCGVDTQATYPIAKIKKMNFVIDPEKCPKCKDQMEFDDLPTEYFSFLRS